MSGRVLLLLALSVSAPLTVSASSSSAAAAVSATTVSATTVSAEAVSAATVSAAAVSAAATLASGPVSATLVSASVSATVATVPRPVPEPAPRPAAGTVPHPAALTATTASIAVSGPAASAALYSAVLTATDGERVSLDRLRGEALIVNFWARWCEPCRREIPELVRAQQRHPQVRIVGIALEHDGAAVREFAQAYEINYTVLLAGEQGVPLLAALGNDAAGLPFTLAIRRDGSVARRFLGVMKPADVDAALEALAADR